MEKCSSLKWQQEKKNKKKRSVLCKTGTERSKLTNIKKITHLNIGQIKWCNAEFSQIANRKKKKRKN